MPIKIIKSTEAITVKNIKILIYGQPGLGKTSIGFTCENPLCLDFDKGAYRSKQRKDSLEITAWSDVVELMNGDELKPYKTIVIDTVGRCLDEITRHLIAENPKLGNRNGALSMQGWGELKGIFQTFMRRMTASGKDVVLIAHDKEDKSGDQVFKRPDIAGGSYAEVLKTADLIGYMFSKANKRTIDFEPCDDFIAKNAANFPLTTVPDFAIEPYFGHTLLTKAKGAMGAVSKEVAEVQEFITAWADTIDGLSSVDEFNAIYPQIKALTPEPVKKQIGHYMTARMTLLGYAFDKANNVFYAPTTEAA